MDASFQWRWLFGSGERETRTKNRVAGAATGARARAEIERLKKELEEALRANKRRAAPFSKGQQDPKPPRRKPAAAYGQRATRPVPSRVDQEIRVPAVGGKRRGGTPCRLPIPFASARSKSDRKPVDGGSAEQRIGVSHKRTARVLGLGYGLKWSRSGVCRAMERLWKIAAPTYEQLQSTLRQIPVVWSGGWERGPQNLRVWLSEHMTVYVIEPHRGYAEAAAISGRGLRRFSGT